MKKICSIIFPLVLMALAPSAVQAQEPCQAQHYYETVDKLYREMPYLWEGMTIEEAGDYEKTLTSEDGCDSIRHLHLNVHYDFYLEETEEYCASKENPYYQWAGHESNPRHGGSLTHSGVYYDSLKTKFGADSIYKLNLTVYPYYHYTTSISFCEGGSATFGGKTYNKAGKYEVKLNTIHGCDSIIDLVVKMDGKFVHTETLKFSNREPLPIKWHGQDTWRGQEITHSGTYYDKYTSKLTGCDSIYELIAIMCPEYEFIKDTAVCENDLPYKWRGREIGSSGTYEDPYKTKQGFDSIYRLTLTVYPAYFADVQINICPGETQEFHGERYSKPGIYQQVHKSINGCDSIWNINVNYKKTFLHQDSIGINDDESYYWSITDSTYAIPDSYELRYQNEDGCDSIYRLILHRNPKYLFKTDTTICRVHDHQYCEWRGQICNTSGTYWDSLHTHLGQDSIYQLNLTIKESTDTIINMTFCHPATYKFGKFTITESGIYRDTIGNAAGCDSIITLVAQFTNHTEELSATICAGEPYIWHGDTLYESGEYSKKSRDEDGCDSIFTLHLTVNYQFDHDYSDTICESQLKANEPYLFNGKFPMYGKWNDKTREYEDSIYWNCDHTHWFRLHVLKPTYRTERITMCEGEQREQLMHNGRIVQFSQSGTYYDTIPAHPDRQERACNDTIIAYVVTVNPTYTKTESKQFNINQLPYTWKAKSGNIMITGPGIYTDSAKTAAGCHDVTIWKVSTLTQEEQSICAGESITFGGQDIKNEGNYTYYYAHKSGMDSIVQLTLHIRQSTRQEIVVHISDQEDYTWVLQNADGSSKRTRVFQHPLTTSQYTDTVKNSQDCDSIITLKLNVHPTYNLHEDVTICASELPYMWEDMQLREANDYEKTYKTKTWSYDSIRTLTLTVNPIYQTKVKKRLCAGEPLVFNNKLYPQPGFYRDTTKTENGCDSVLIIDFQWVYTDTKPLTAECSDQELPYIWKVGDKEIELDHTGVYHETLKSVNPECECDSVVELRLTVYPTYHYEESVSVCRSELPYEWHGQLLEETKDYIDKQTTKQGYDSIYVMHFTVQDTAVTRLNYELCHGESVEVNSTTYTEPGIYRDETLRTQDGCDSILIIDLRWKPTYFTHIDVQCNDQECNENHPYMWHVTKNIITPLYHGGTFRKTTKSELNGCDSIIELTLTVYPTYHYEHNIQVCRDELPYEWHGQLLKETNDYIDRHTTKQGYDSVYIVHFTVRDTAVTRLTFSECPGTSIVVNSRIYNNPGLYEDKSLRTQDGCDSTLIIDFRWKDAYIKYLSVNRSDKECNENTPYEWKVGNHPIQFLTHSGTYRDTLESVITGCDSIIELTLTVYPTYLYEQTMSVCRNELPFQWHGQVLTETGTYTDKQTTKQGYDSIYTIQFTVLEAKKIRIDTTVCHGEYVEINSRRYDQPGRYEDKSLKTDDGCDSVLIINLRWYDTYFKQEKASCSIAELPYHWSVNNTVRELDHAGTFREKMKSINGCDSIIELTLTVYPTYEFTENRTVCESELPFIWHSQQIDREDDYTASYTTILGHDSIYRMHLTVLPVKTTTVSLSMCQGETKSVNGKLYSVNGQYTDTLKTTNGCDSILIIQVKVYEPYNEITNAVTSNTKPYIWRGNEYKTAGTYTERGGKMEDCDCDTIFTLYLKVYEEQVLLADPGREICESEVPYMWRGHKCDTTGTYYDTVRTLTTDTVRSFKLKVNRFQHDTIRHLLCEGETFIFNGLTIKNDTLYHDTIHTGIGCGTDYLIDIRHRQVVTKHFYEKTDDQNPYLWDMNGKTYKLSGDYEYIELSEDGLCDSVRNILHLTVYPTYLIESTIETCDNEPITWRGNEYKQTGTYYDSLQTNIVGYDSVYVLHLTVNPSYLIEEKVTVKEGQTTSLHGINITRPGVYWDTLYTQHGCDSVYKIMVNMTRSYRKEYNDTICNGETYHFGGKTYRKSATLRDTIGIDSVVICHLEVLPSYYNEERKVLYPEQFPYLYHGKLYRTQGTYDDTLRASNGCDSILRMHLVQSEHCSDWDYVPLCTGETLYIDSTAITKIGSYSFLRRSRITNQMDSLYLVQVYQASAYDMPEESIRICKGDTIEWNGKRYWRNGVYDQKLSTIEGCDSIVHLNLIVHPTYHFYTDALIADYESYTWRGNEYNTPGEYDMSYPTQEGCDSTYTLRLKVMETERIYTVDTICKGDTYLWQGKVLSQEGTYYDTLYLPGSYTSKIYMIQLHETTPTIIRNARVGEICADADAFVIEFAYDGAKPARYSVQFDQAAQRQGFENVYDAPYHGIVSVQLPVHEKVLYRGYPDFVRPDNYRLRLTVDNGICGVSKSDTLVLQVRYPSWIIEQSWNDVVYPLSKELNGGYEFSRLEWYVNGSKFDTNGRDYIYSDALREDDKVVLYATRMGENYSIPTCPLTIQRPEISNTQYPTLLYPNRVSRHLPEVTLEAQENGMWYIYSSTGALTASGHFTEGTQTLTLPCVNNCYLVRMVTESGQINTQKVILF